MVMIFKIFWTIFMTFIRYCAILSTWTPCGSSCKRTKIKDNVTFNLEK